MVNFIVAGKPNCKNYNHALYVANYLKKRLPNFNLCSIEKESEDWQYFLDETNKKRGWYHTTSPLIWKELCYRGGKAYLIGGLSEFWEYCYDYYGLISKIPYEELCRLAAEHKENFDNSNETKSSNNVTTICITGATNPIVQFLLPELCNIQGLASPGGIAIKLFDQYVGSKHRGPFLQTLMKDFDVLPTSVFKEIELVSLIGDGVKDCDLLIIADLFKPKDVADSHDKLIKNMSLMLIYADAINVFAKRSIRIILFGNGPECFNATVLVETCTRIRVSNIVAVTSHIGLSCLTGVSQQTGVPLRELGGPPVWGFIGVNEFVDLDSIIKYSEIYIPYARAVSTTNNATLPKGKIKAELRFLAYLLEDPEIILFKAQERQKDIMKKLRQPPTFAKLRAVTSLLRLWYSREERDDIISLGVCSNGAFGLPNGVVFSQPVMMNKQKIWVPFEKFPVSNKSKEEIEKLIPAVQELLDGFGLCGTKTQNNYNYI